MNAPAMPGRSMTWRKWLDEYDPVELCFDVGMTQRKTHILNFLNHQIDQDGTAVGDEWRADNGRWYMRGRRWSNATNTATR
jgi:hypothetical protein